MKFFQIYQFVVPIVLFPLSYWLWLRRYEGDHRLTLLALSIPILFSYIIPALGTNWFKIWEFNIRFKIGRFRPQHGFVFGTATSLLGWAVLDFPRTLTAWDLAQSAFIMGSVLAFWNWWYDTLALQAGFLCVYTQAYGEGKGPAAIAFQYAPVFFGIFGCCYGLSIRWIELVLVQQQHSEWFWGLAIGCHALVLSIPVIGYMLYAKLTIGDWGLRSYDPSLQVAACASSSDQRASTVGQVARREG